MSLQLLMLNLKGGPGSGYHGHSGVPGKRGGSAPRSAISAEATTPPPPGNFFNPDVEKGEAARVGVPAEEIPPPPPVPKLPNLTKFERKVEQDFMDAYHKDPDGMASRFREIVLQSGSPPTFGTDDAKVLTNKWGGDDLNQRAANRAMLNTPLHQTANAIAKRAFVQHLDTLKPGDEVMVTVGGCGAGKGYALKNVPDALDMKNRSKAVWDSAGDQNATENKWIQKELEKRGLKGNYVFVHADPKTQWADPNRGVVQRAKDPKDGRMVDAKVFADSYALGAKNHQKFFEANKDNPNASFVFLDNTSSPKKLPGIPQEALSINRKELTDFAINTVRRDRSVPPHIKKGALMGTRIWGNS